MCFLQSKFFEKIESISSHWNVQLMHLNILPGHWRHEQIHHDLGGRDVQTPVQIHRTQRPRVGKTSPSPPVGSV